MPLTQVEAAKIMYAAEKWAEAVDETNNASPANKRYCRAAEKKAEADFADLISELVEDEHGC